MSSVTTTLLVIAFIVFLPIIVPVAMFLDHRSTQRLRRLVQSIACQNCGKILGLKALHLADAEWTAYVAELHKQKPGIRLRLVRTLHAICPHCGIRYTFFEKDNELRVEAQEFLTKSSNATSKPASSEASEAVQG